MGTIAQINRMGVFPFATTFVDQEHIGINYDKPHGSAIGETELASGSSPSLKMLESRKPQAYVHCKCDGGNNANRTHAHRWGGGTINPTASAVGFSTAAATPGDIP
jgi:hypothetical protein